MADTGERNVRDRLAEALWYHSGAARGSWPFKTKSQREYFRRRADDFLASLPTVGLRIGRVEE